MTIPIKGAHQIKWVELIEFIRRTELVSDTNVPAKYRMAANELFRRFLYFRLIKERRILNSMLSKDQRRHRRRKLRNSDSWVFSNWKQIHGILIALGFCVSLGGQLPRREEVLQELLEAWFMRLDQNYRDFFFHLLRIYKSGGPTKSEFYRSRGSKNLSDAIDNAEKYLLGEGVAGLEVIFTPSSPNACDLSYLDMSAMLMKSTFQEILLRSQDSNTLASPPNDYDTNREFIKLDSRLPATITGRPNALRKGRLRKTGIEDTDGKFPGLPQIQMESSDQIADWLRAAVGSI